MVWVATYTIYFQHNKNIFQKTSIRVLLKQFDTEKLLTELPYNLFTLKINKVNKKSKRALKYLQFEHWKPVSQQKSATIASICSTVRR